MYESLLFFIILYLSIAIHEYGHYKAMKDHGVPIKLFYIGSKLSKYFPRYKRINSDGTIFYFSPLPIKAFVLGRASNLTQKAYMDIAIRGIKHNLYLFLFFLFLVVTFYVTLNKIYDILAIASLMNLVFAISNLLPLKNKNSFPTDGYEYFRAKKDATKLYTQCDTMNKKHKITELCSKLFSGKELEDLKIFINSL